MRYCKYLPTPVGSVPPSLFLNMRIDIGHFNIGIDSSDNIMYCLDGVNEICNLGDELNIFIIHTKTSTKCLCLRRICMSDARSHALFSLQ